MRLLFKIFAGLMLFEVADRFYPHHAMPPWTEEPAMLLTMAVIFVALRRA